MTRARVLAAAAALNEFTAAQVAAYCEDDLDSVTRIIRDHDELFAPVPHACTPRWRVTDRRLLRAVIAAAEGRGQPAAAGHRPGPDGSREDRLLLAEQTLIDCAEEPSAAGRRTMAATAANYLRQFVAATPEAGDGRRWWEVEPSCLDALGDRVTGDAATVSRSRLRTDFALARLTGSEAANEQVGIGFLIETATELTRLLGSAEAGEERICRLSRRFADLAMKLTTPSAPGNPGAVAPAKLLSALAWRRAGPAAQGGWDRAARAQVALLRTIADRHPLVPDEGHARLYRDLDQPRHGRKRVAVYQDLLDLLPSRYDWEPVEALLPGAVVTAVTDLDACRLLRRYASVIEGDLVSSPYGSERALVGQVAHRFEEFADAQAGRDRTVADRTTETRKQLLALFDVDV
jgi:hypothetical protein